MEVPMQSAREAGLGRASAASAPRGPATNRTLVWFSGEAERRRRTAAAAQEASSGRAAIESAWVGLNNGSFDEIRRRAQARRVAYLTALVRRGTAWLRTLPRRTAAPAGNVARGASPRAAAWQRSEVFGCVALAALALAFFEAPSPNAVGARPCRTEPAVLAPSGDFDVTMTLSHNAACAIWAHAASISVKDVTITTAPQHGTVALRGRTGVTYRPARGFTGTDSFAFTLHSTSASGGAALTARVHATVN
jgi:hypothetical protein